MKKLLFTSLLILVGFVFTTNTLSQIQSNGTGGGDWNTGVTWSGGIIPTVSDNVIIQGSDIVTLVAAGSCADFTLNAGATLSLNAAALVIPGSSWNFDQTSTVIYNGTTTVQTAMAYGNLVYSTAGNGGVSPSAPANLTINGNLTISGGTFRGNASTSGSVTHTVAGNVTLSGTTSRITGVNNSSATTASCTWNIGGNVSLTASNSGNRLQVYESAGPHSGSSIFNIGGNLEISGDGTSANSSQVMYKGSTSVSANYPDGVINLSGNLIQNGPIGINNAGDAYSGAFKINFIGSSAQTWSGTGAFSVTPLLMKIFVKIDNAAGVSLTDPRTFNTNTVLNLINGNLTTDATNLLTVNTGTISGGSSSSFINGPLAQTFESVDPTVKTFPVGKGTAYRPVNLIITHDAATATTYTTEVYNDAPTTSSLPGTINKVSSVRYYSITKGAGANVTAAEVQLSYNTDDGVTDFNNLRIAKDDDAGNWVDLGGTGSANTIGTITSTTNFTTFSYFVLANNTGGANDIPVEIISFTSSLNGSDVLLYWSTATELNNYGFEIEKSLSNGKSGTWEKVGFINGAGNSTSINEYFFCDKFWKQNGTYLYRLKQIDFNGKFEYSTELMAVIDLPQHYSLSQNYPNPFNPSTNIDYTLPADSKVTLAIYSLIGEKVADLVKEEQASGYYSYQFSSRDLNLTSGVYVYKLTAVSKSNDLFSQSRKMLLLK